MDLVIFVQGIGSFPTTHTTHRCKHASLLATLLTLYLLCHKPQKKMQVTQVSQQLKVFERSLQTGF